MTASASALSAGPDLRLSAADYGAVAEHLYSLAGITLREGKEALVISRLGKRVRVTGMKSLSEYIHAVIDGAVPAELTHFIDVLTTNKTGFFREPAHFDFMVEELFPEWAARRSEVRMWSAASSSGEEPYTVAMLVRDHLPSEVAARTRILATDISTRILDAARTGRYTTQQTQGIPPDLLQKYFDRDATGDGWTARKTLKDLVKYARLNLMEDWPMKGPFDLILCRNVMIYFDRETQERLVNRFAALLAPGGVLMVGHAESLSGIRHSLEQLQPAVFRKRGLP
ncbi:MAG: protein-glutamate O-methyltransferase CheR [Gemmatimonadaceae bacterium]|nr:protein-glutamate O-methyltransferase CheR [Gemmatimonadaceae bacterium]